MDTQKQQTLQIWVAKHPWTIPTSHILPAGLIKELRENPGDPRCDELAAIVTEELQHLGKSIVVAWSDLSWHLSIGRTRPDDVSAI